MSGNIVNDNGSITVGPENELVFVQKARLVLKTVNRLSGGRQVFAVTDENVKRLHPELLPEENIYVIKAGEDSKTFATVENICRAMLEGGMTRSCIVAAFGGGVVGDIAGFAAAVYMRGVQFINVPTTLLSQVDSSIGGKTGVNIDGYKNMIGCFKMPTHIVICSEVLASLPEREWRCGMGELIKTAALDEKIYEYVRKNIKAVCGRDMNKTEKAVEMAARFKKKVTDDDPTEQGNRAILNFGHTVGHALEKCDNHRLSHGEYVLLGMKIELAMLSGGYDTPSFVSQMGEMLAAAGLPELPEIPDEEVCAAAKTDKKNSSGKIAVIGLIGAGKAGISYFTAKEFADKYSQAVKYLVEKGELKRG